jgi:hypothetical protein
MNLSGGRERYVRISLALLPACPPAELRQDRGEIVRSPMMDSKLAYRVIKRAGPPARKRDVLSMSLII